MFNQIEDQSILSFFHIDMDLRGVLETVPCLWIVPVSLRRTPSDDGYDVMLQCEGHQSMGHVGHVLLSFCLHTLTIIDVSETWKEQESGRYALEEGIQLVHHNIIGLAGIEGSAHEDVVHHGFWFKTVFKGPVGKGFDTEHVLGVDENG